MLILFNQNDLPSEVLGDPDVRTWTASDPQLELWATNEETWYVQFKDPARATMFMLRYPEVCAVVQELYPDCE